MAVSVTKAPTAQADQAAAKPILIKLIKGARYMYKGKVYEAKRPDGQPRLYQVDARNRNYLVRTGHFNDHIPDALDGIVDLPEDADGPLSESVEVEQQQYEDKVNGKGVAVPV
jgi:hypothetical protein